ncbi:right-handed parallel beta-helix repeat-containing protein [Neobacillus niacini]|uniref:right-handed parallel beta-helix repeat-containing protein n=1 Tax=Neobacillus niacini TaxID=86668 RepID=UPI002FFDC2AF
MELRVSKKLFSKFKTINQAIDKAPPGSTIFIEPGVYNEKIVIDKELRLIGDGPVDSIVLTNTDNTVLTIEDNVKVSGLTIYRDGQKLNDSHWTVEVLAGKSELENCTINSKSGDGISIFYSHTNIVMKRCRVRSSGTVGMGVLLSNGAQGTLEECDINGSTMLNTGSDAVMKKSKFYNSKSSGILVTKSTCEVVECELYDNEYSNIVIAEEARLKVRKSKMYRSGEHGILIKETAKGTIEDSDLFETRSNITIEGTGEVKRCKIHQGSVLGIYVNNGVARIEDSEIFDNKTNIDFKSTRDSVVERCKIYSSSVMGLWVRDSGIGRIQDCQIYDNQTSVQIDTNGEAIVKRCKVYHGGIGISVDEQGKSTLEDCEIFSNNTNVTISEGAHSFVRRSKIYNGDHCGVGVSENGRGILEDCEIYDNPKFGVISRLEGDVVVQGCKIFNNDCGIFAMEKGKISMDDCEVYGNNYSGITIESEGSAITNKTKIFNNAQFGITVDNMANGKFHNCKIYGNQETNIKNEAKSSLDLVECEVYNSELNVAIGNRAKATIEGCEIYDSSGSNIVVANNGNIQIKDTKIHKSEQFGVLVVKDSKAEIKNCEIFNNGTNTQFDEDSKVIIVDNPPSQNKNRAAENSVEVTTTQEIVEKNVDLEGILKEINALIGMDNIKKSINEMIQLIQFNRELVKLGIEPEEGNLKVPHIVLHGNPGTGKTTVAKLVGKLYKAMGLLSSGHTIHVNREKLVGEYVGQTAPKTVEKINEAMGGVLFIDEAYELTNKGTKNDFGPEAIAVLLEEMENRRGEFMVIVAGYEKEMEQFLEVNPGLKSRFTQYYQLQDYTPDEMIAIAEKMITEKNREITSDAKSLLHKEFTGLYRKRDRYFSNARTVRNNVDDMYKAQATRCMNTPKESWTKEFLLTLTIEDVEAALPKKEEKVFEVPINEGLLSETLSQLNAFIGMDNVKEEIEKLITLVRFYREEGRPLNELSPHTLLLGSPGTGKTEVARIIAKIYEALGILERGDLIEVNRDKLVSQYAGETEKITTKFIDQAIGGTLFIDEAYQLTQYGNQDPGHKVVEVLLKRMEDDRGFFIVIAAGYPNNMKQFLESNDGLGRRFSRRIEFEDYTPPELMQISEMIVNKKEYVLDAQVQETLYDYYQLAYRNRDESFGNAGFARNIMIETMKNTDYRVAQLPKEERFRINSKMVIVEDLALNQYQ